MVQTEFTTPRLRIAHWRTARAIQTERKALENALLDLLTPPVLAHLPPSLQLLNRKDSLTDWITARDAESDVLTVRQQQDGMLIGLMILAPSPAATQPPVLHLGYLLRETAWGQGYATEIVGGFISAQSRDTALTLRGGVDTANPASARVLKKCGFTRRDDLSDMETALYERTLP